MNTQNGSNGKTARTNSGTQGIQNQKYRRDEYATRSAQRQGGGGGMVVGFGGGGGMVGGHGMPVDKVKDLKKTLKQLLRYMWPYKWMMLSIIVLSGIASSVNVLTPAISLRIIDNLSRVANGMFDRADLLKWVSILTSVSLSSALCGLFQQRISAKITQKLVFGFRHDLEGKLSRLPLKYFDGRTHGEILSRVVYDVDTVGRMLQMSITQVITTAITITGVLFMMIRLNPLLTLIAMSVTPLYLLVVYVIAPRSQRYFVGQSRAQGDLNGHVEEMYGGQKIVKLFGYEQNSIDEFEEINEHYFNYSRNAQFISGMIRPLIMFLGNFGYVLVCVVGGIFMTRGTVSLGTIAAFMQYIRQFNMPLAQISHIAEHIQSVLAASERVFAVLDEEEEPQESSSPQDISDPLGMVRFEHVEFGYSPDKILMNDMDINVQPGQTVAIVGPTGAGKTTLVNLLMRFYDVGKGKITVDGIDIRDMTRGSLRSMFGMVLQDTWLYNASIRDNIKYGTPGASEEQVIAASVASRSNHFIRTLRDGFDSVINEDATNISQGQKQLIAIARAFLADPAILILDEATSNVDTRTEVLIQRSMEDLMKDRTGFIIAHRLSTIRNADIILVMNHGSIIETGTHETLLRDRGFYYDMYNSQFRGQSELNSYQA